ncbi:ROK family transcriptional regulator [Georgenia halophila]|uniref:ROK family transcriptional regulator n=1 Tax=Georgenia halophila TaxID=620889 RepID=A0ABP8LBM4_9MICO
MNDHASPWMPLEGSSQAVALEVLLHGPLSRSELARRVHLSHASLSRLTKPLVSSGLLVEGMSSPRPAGMGRPKQPLDVVEDAHHFLGVKLTGDRAHAVVTTMRARVVGQASAPLPDHGVPSVVELVQRLAAEADEEVGNLAGIGVSVGGLVSDGAVVEHATFLEWEDVQLADVLAERTGLPVVVENDVTALTEAERWFGAGRDRETFTVLTIGAGIGYGLVSHGRLVTSGDAGLGPVGHALVAPGGPRCGAGHSGCAAAVLTAHALSAAVATATGRWLRTDEILRLAREGDAVARRVVGDAGRALGRLVGTAASFSLSSTVVLSGEEVGLADAAHDAVRAGIREVRHPMAEPVTIETRSAGFDEWARGAAVVAIQAFVTGG